MVIAVLGDLSPDEEMESLQYTTVTSLQFPTGGPGEATLIAILPASLPRLSLSHFDLLPSSKVIPARGI